MRISAGYFIRSGPQKILDRYLALRVDFPVLLSTATLLFSHTKVVFHISLILNLSRASIMTHKFRVAAAAKT